MWSTCRCDGHSRRLYKPCEIQSVMPVVSSAVRVAIEIRVAAAVAVVVSKALVRTRVTLETPVEARIIGELTDLLVEALSGVVTSVSTEAATHALTDVGIISGAAVMIASVLVAAVSRGVEVSPNVSADAVTGLAPGISADVLTLMTAIVARSSTESGGAAFDSSAVKSIMVAACLQTLEQSPSGDRHSSMPLLS